MRDAAVITGLGVLSCNGLGRKAYWEAIGEGRSGIGPLNRFDASDLPCRIAGQLWDFDPADFMKKSEVRRWFRHVHQAIACSRMAVEDAQIDQAGYAPERIAVGFGTSVGSPNDAYHEQLKAYTAGGYKKIDRIGSTAFSAHSATVNIGIDFGMRGPAITIASGCATGIDMLHWGMTQLATDRADAVLVGATEAPIFPMSLASACSLGILSKRNDEPEKAMRPYDRNRDGIVLSEAGVALILERGSKARARGAQIFGEVAGFGSAAEGRNPLLLDQEGEAFARAVRIALEDAHAQPNEIDHIQSHGVSLEMYDRCETNGYKRALGDHIYRIPVSAVKSMTGQAYSAGGLLGVAAALLPLNGGCVPPTINLDDPDPECDLDYVPHAARLNDIQTALVCAMSFGGTHSAAVLRRYN